MALQEIGKNGKKLCDERFFPHRSNRGNYPVRHWDRFAEWTFISTIYSNLNIAQYRLVIPITGSDKDLIDSPEFLILTKDQQKKNFVKQPYLFFYFLYLFTLLFSMWVESIKRSARNIFQSDWLLARKKSPCSGYKMVDSRVGYMHLISSKLEWKKIVLIKTPPDIENYIVIKIKATPKNTPTLALVEHG